MSCAYDAVVVGAGPAGLSAAAALTAAGRRCLVVEQGAAHGARDRRAPEEILSGVGGAGLFSDGKHSFYPAATELWRLADTERLRAAYESTRRQLSRHGVSAPELAHEPDTGSGTGPSAGPAGLQLKRYPSVYVPLEERMRCIDDLYDQCGELPWLSARVVDARRDGALLRVHVEQDGQARVVEAASLVVATGRLSPRWTRTWLSSLGVTFAFRRLELGVRIETDAGAPLFSMLEGVDPKLSFVDEGDEAVPPTKLLTFCACRDGEVVTGSACNMHAVSGRADGPRTGRSNIGLLARVTDPRVARQIEPHLFGSASPFHAPLLEVLAAPQGHPRMVATFGAVGARVLGRALERFVGSFPELGSDRDATLHGPCIEGVGDYPLSDGALEIAPSVFVAGDACGRFRGIVASMVSGRYVAAQIIAASESERR